MGSFVLFLLAMIALAHTQKLTEDQKVKIMEYNRECMEETKVDMEVALKATEGVYVDDEKLKKQILCFNKKIKVQKENGDIDIDVTKKKLMTILKDEKKVDDVIKKCVVKKDTPEDTAFEAAKCMHKLSPNPKSQTLTEEEKAMMRKYQKECMEETHVDMKALEKAALGEYEDDEKLKKQISCVYKKIKILKENGEIDIDVTRAKLLSYTKDEKKTEEIIEKCAVNKGTPENTAFEASKCMRKLVPNTTIPA